MTAAAFGFIASRGLSRPLRRCCVSVSARVPQVHVLRIAVQCGAVSTPAIPQLSRSLLEGDDKRKLRLETARAPERNGRTGGRSDRRLIARDAKMRKNGEEELTRSGNALLFSIPSCVRRGERGGFVNPTRGEGWKSHKRISAEDLRASRLKAAKSNLRPSRAVRAPSPACAAPAHRAPA